MGGEFSYELALLSIYFILTPLLCCCSALPRLLSLNSVRITQLQLLLADRYCLCFARTVIRLPQMFWNCPGC